MTRTGRRPRHRAAQRVTDVAVKVFRRALTAGETPEGWLGIEGPNLFIEALKAAGYLEGAGRDGPRPEPDRVKIHSVLATERQAEKLGEALDLLPEDIEVILIPEPLFERVTQTEAPQGIAALVELPERNLEAVLAGPDVIVVIACGLQDPGNLGSILRSAHAFGASALLTLSNTVSPFNPKVVRSSAGAIIHLPVFTEMSSDSLLQRLRGGGFRILASDRDGPVPIAQADLRGPVAILIGREASGLDETVMRMADVRVAIPIRSGTDSLNAAAAGSVLLYEAARQRGFRFHEPV
jgi:RNA methyltransferase, TrmH family